LRLECQPPPALRDEAQRMPLLHRDGLCRQQTVQLVKRGKSIRLDARNNRMEGRKQRRLQQCLPVGWRIHGYTRKSGTDLDGQAQASDAFGKRLERSGGQGGQARRFPLQGGARQPIQQNPL